MTFEEFYRHVYLAEHRVPANVGLHVAGTLAGLALVPLALAVWSPWLLLAFPVVHAAPGLVGHRLYERSAEVGDLRVNRRDYPKRWFVAANHRLTWEVLTRRRRA